MRLTENMQIVSGFVPVDMQSGANTGDWVNLSNFGHCAVVLFKAAGTAGDDPTLTIQQAKDVDGDGVKELDFTTIAVKQGAALNAIGQYTLVTQAAGETYTHADAAEAQALWIVGFQPEDLDVDNGFCCLRASVADVGGNAQLGCLFYLLSEPRFAGHELTSAIE